MKTTNNNLKTKTMRTSKASAIDILLIGIGNSGFASAYGKSNPLEKEINKRN